MSFAFDPPPLVSAAIAGEDARFPVHRIYCVGRNYAAHAREMGGDPDRERPFFFLKPADALVAYDGDPPRP
jgi:fumarylpyruvate hydrolase